MDGWFRLLGNETGDQIFAEPAPGQFIGGAFLNFSLVRVSM